MRKIFIFDTTLRDGEQSPGASLNAAEKMEIAKQLAKLNVDVIEAGFPISSREDFEAVSAIAQDVKGPIICALARAKEEDIISAGEALKYGGNTMLHTFIGTSNLQVFDVLKKTREQVLKMAIDAVRLAKSYCDEVEFSAMDASRTEDDYLYEIIQAAIEAGATVINIPDTVGYAIPDNFGRLINDIFANVRDINKVRISVHCHDDLGLATANAITAVEAGATQIECAINGMGERAGNTALEEVVAAIMTRGDYLGAYTDIRIKEFAAASKLVSRLMGFVISPNKPIAGENAFRHSSGIHQDGVLKNRGTFEILHGEDWGYGNIKSIELTARSGRHALQHRLSRLGYELTKEQLEASYTRFLELADKKKQVVDSDLEAIAEIILRGIGGLSIVSVAVVSDADKIFKATVTVQKGVGTIEWKGEAKDGSLDAVFRAINTGIQKSFEVADYHVDSVGKGSDAQARVVVRIKYNGGTIRGVGVDTDTVKASAQAYLDAINRALTRESSESGFNPQMIGKPQPLITGQKYSLPERPAIGFLLVAVKGSQVAFFQSATWQGGHYKSGTGWLFFNTAQEAESVCFPQYRLGKTSKDHRHGLPNFYRNGELLE